MPWIGAGGPWRAGRRPVASALLVFTLAMRTAVRSVPVGPDEALLIGVTGLVLVAGLTIGGDSGLAYLVVALPIVLGISWWRPVYGFALLLGLVLLTEEFEISTLAGGIEPWLLQSLPIFRNLQDYTPLDGIYANAVEAWIGLLVGHLGGQGAAHRAAPGRPGPVRRGLAGRDGDHRGGVRPGRRVGR